MIIMSNIFDNIRDLHLSADVNIFEILCSLWFLCADRLHIFFYTNI